MDIAKARKLRGKHKMHEVQVHHMLKTLLSFLDKYRTFGTRPFDEKLIPKFLKRKLIRSR